MSRRVNLVGSIGLDTLDEVFTSVGRLLGPHLRRMPHREVGGRRMWISWQAPLLRANPFLQVVPAPIGREDDAHYAPSRVLRLNTGPNRIGSEVRHRRGMRFARARRPDVVKQFLETHAGAAAL